MPRRDGHASGVCRRSGIVEHAFAGFYREFRLFAVFAEYFDGSDFLPVRRAGGEVENVQEFSLRGNVREFGLGPFEPRGEVFGFHGDGEFFAVAVESAHAERDFCVFGFAGVEFRRPVAHARRRKRPERLHLKVFFGVSGVGDFGEFREYVGGLDFQVSEHYASGGRFRAEVYSERV